MVWPTLGLLASWESNMLCYANHRVQQHRTSHCLCVRVSPEILALNKKSHLKKYVVNGFGLVFVGHHSSFLTCHHHQSFTHIGVTLCGFPVFILSRNSGTGQSCQHNQSTIPWQMTRRVWLLQLTMKGKGSVAAVAMYVRGMQSRKEIHVS